MSQHQPSTFSEKYQHLFSSSRKVVSNNNNNFYSGSIGAGATVNSQNHNISSTGNSNTGLYSSRPSTSTMSTFIRGNGIKEPIAMPSRTVLNSANNNWSTLASQIPSSHKEESNVSSLSSSSSLLNNYKMSLGGFKRELSPSSVRKNLDVQPSVEDEHQIHELTSTSSHQQLDYLSRSSIYQKTNAIKPITSWKPLSEQERSVIAGNLFTNTSLNTSSTNNKTIFDDSSEEEDDDLIASRKRMKMNHGKLHQLNDSFKSNTTHSTTNTIGLSNTLNSRPSIIHTDVITNSILSNPLSLADRFKRLNEKVPQKTSDSKPSLLVTKSLFSNVNSNLGALNSSILNKENTSPIKPRESIYVNINMDKSKPTVDNTEEDMSFTRIHSSILTNTLTSTNNSTTLNLSGPIATNASIVSSGSNHSKTVKSKTLNASSSLNSSISSVTSTINTNNHMTSGKYQQIKKNKEELITYQTLFYQIHFIVAMVLQSFERQELRVEQDLYNAWCFVQERKKSLHDRREQLFKKQATLKLNELLNHGLNVRSIDKLLSNLDNYYRNYNEIQMELRQTLNCIAIADDIEVSTPEMIISNGIESGIELAFSLEKSFKVLHQIINEMNQVMSDTSQLKTQFTHLDEIIHQSTGELNRLSNNNIPYLSNIESEHTSLAFQCAQTSDRCVSSDPFAFNLLRESLGL